VFLKLKPQSDLLDFRHLLKQKLKYRRNRTAHKKDLSVNKLSKEEDLKLNKTTLYY